MQVMIREAAAPAAELVQALDDHILKVMMHLQERGWGTSEILDALEIVCRHQREAYEQDPDPAGDPAIVDAR
jgi:hypothetical protein